MARKPENSSCELPSSPGKSPDNRNKHYKFKGDFTWKGVKVQRYKDEGADWSEIARQAIIGASGESAKFHLRYFEIASGGFSSFETHKHEHVVIAVRGRGSAKVGRRTIELNYLDVLYINPDTPHRLSNPNDDPFGVFCIVNAKRDRPKPVKKPV